MTGHGLHARVPLWALVSGCLLGWLAEAAPAQAQAAEDGILYNRQPVFRIPFDLLSAAGRPREVRLYVSLDHGQTWKYYSTARLPQQEFVFQTEQDGLYWFTTQSIGADNRAYPPVVENVRPDLRVCVDRRPPTVLLRPLPPRDGQVGVEWDVRDDNLNPATLRLEYRVSPMAEWQLLPVGPLASHQHYWNPGANGSVEVRLRVYDRAENLGEETTLVAADGRSLRYGGATPEVAPVRSPPPADTPTRLVNSKKIRMKYDIREMGKSGLSVIELWYTQDKYTRTWKRLGEYNGRDYGKEDPVLEFELPDEGLYGLALVAKSGVNLGGRPPQSGEPPQFWVEVDLTKPTVRIQQPELGRGADKDKLYINWIATDKNLNRQRSILLFYAECREGQPEGPWAPIPADVDNTGRYIWPMPHDVPLRFVVKVEAKDLAGNVGSDVSKPVVVDLAQPKGFIVDVEPVNK